MKKVMILLLGILIISSITYADIIPEGTHMLYEEIIFSNIDEFPDYKLIAAHSLTGNIYHSVSIVEQGVPLDRGYKFNMLEIYAIRTEDLEALGGVENIDIDHIVEKFRPLMVFPFGHNSYIPDDNPLYLEGIIYTIVGIKDGYMEFYVSREYSRNPSVVQDYNCE